MAQFERWNLYALLLISSFALLFESANGLYCHVCTSDKLEQCSTFNLAEELPSELCPADVTSCFTKIASGITVRGCMTRQRQNQCNDGTCSICRTNKCNSQIYPENRLSCIHCEGSGCVNQTNTVEVRYPCANYREDDSCYSVFSSDGSEAYRGCMSDFSTYGREFCMQNILQCNICPKRACNSNPLEFEKKMSCIKCEPDENSNCNVIDESVKATECAPTTVGYTNECFTYQNGSVSRRGCLYEAPPDIFSECTDVWSDRCTTCNKSDCNRSPIINNDLTLNPFHFVITEEGGKKIFTPCGNSSCEKIDSWDRKCFKCDSTIDINCVSEVDASMIGQCPYAEEDLGCFHMVTDSKVVRGCVVDLDGEEKEKCMANDDTCKTCFELECNSKKSLSKCYVTDEPFKHVPKPFYTKATPKICRKYDEKCFTQVLENYLVVRGCVGDYAAEHDLSPDFLSKNVPENKYKLCSGPLCNKGLDLTYCYSCNSSDPECGEHLQFNTKLRKQCPMEAQSSGCYQLIKGDYVERGCMSELIGDTHAECQSDSEQCKKCFGNDCNDAKQFSRCFWSDHADYMGVSDVCKKYKDPCITHATKDVVRRGCLNDWFLDPPHDVDIVSDCENRPTICEKCTTPNCNNRFILREYCLSCSPNDGISCKHYTTDKMRVMCPFSVQKLGCYHRVHSFGSVTRGCTSSLNLQELSECQSTNSNCKTCMGDSCNKRFELPMCIDCSSEVDGENCKTNTLLLTERQCTNYDDQCYIHIENDVVTRNCTDDGLVAVNECKDNPNCAVCDSRRCNGRIIEPEICIDCDSDKDPACNSADVLKDESFLNSCPLSLNENGCYHYMDHIGSRHVRGCAAKLPNSNQLQKHTNKQFRTCKGKKCNSEPSLPKCLVCNSTEDENCATSPNSTHSQVCDVYKNECFTLISTNNVARGCLADVDDQIKEECEKDNLKCAIYATTDIVGLNNSSVNAVDTCIECDSKINSTCRTNPDEFKGKICDRIETSKAKGCYLSIRGDHVIRGCVQDLKVENATECLANSDNCKICKGKDCNSRIRFQECYSCNSQSDPLCARNPEKANSEICTPYHSNCVTGIDRAGFIHRQCANKKSNHERKFDDQYQTCEEHKCNKEIYPPDRLQCYQCTSDDKKCDMMEKNELKPEPCSISSIYDQCFTYIGPDKKIFRGCLSDATNERLLCERVNEHKNGSCVKCNSTGCNNQPKFEQPTLSCMNCTGSEECAFGLENSDKSYKCEKNVVFGDTETCFTHSIDGIEVERGCTLDYNSVEEDWCKVEDDCNTCANNDCNIENARFSWCVRCESDVKGDCAVISKLDSFIGQCGRSPYPYSKRGCYTDVKNGTVTRGCISDLTDEQHTNCDKQEKCILCTGDNCNKHDNSSSVKKSANLFMCSVAILLAFILQNH